jgi:hypothetical protein
MGLLAKWLGLCFAVLVVLVSVQPGAARDLTAQEEAALAQAVERFGELMRTQDWPAMIEASIPPRVMDDMLKASGQTKEHFTKVIAGIMAETMAKMNVQSYSMDLAKAAKKEHADGTPYLFIPTALTVKVDGGDKVAIRSHTLGMMEAEKWYLVRVTDPQQQTVLVRIYPEYIGVEFPGETSEILKE